MKVTVVGAGKMGLPLACQFAHNGATVTACDVNPAIVKAINEGRCPIDEPSVPELLSAAVEEGRLIASTDTENSVAHSDVVVVIVPAVLTHEQHIDLKVLETVSAQIASGLHPGMMISYETTVFVGCTRKHLRPILEKSGLAAGKDFDLVFSPERVKSQNVLRNLTKIPKIVGGFDDRSGDRGVAFYKQFLGAPTIRLGSMEEAEFSKLMGMIYRDVNIALATEFARYAESVGMDIQGPIHAANTDGEAAILQPGIGVGGHCTPVYPYFVIHDAIRRGMPVTLAERARRINDQQASHVLRRIEKEWGALRGKKALILGLAFRPQVKEHSHSTAFLLREELATRGAEVVLHDPLYSDDEIRAHGFVPGSWKDDPAPSVVILNTAHSEYERLDFAALAGRGVEILVDGRNVWSATVVRTAGLKYIGVGKSPERPLDVPPPTIPVAKPVLEIQEADAAAETIRSGWIMQGPKVEAFEREFADFTGAPYACAVSSGTAALHLALLAVGVAPGDEVITVSHSFIATANSVRYCGANPVFVDIEPDTFNINPTLIERAITPKTRAILCVHQFGMPCDLTAILRIARTHELFVVEDAACAIGSEIILSVKPEKIGKPHSDIACFSFHPRKMLTTGDGGMIVTTNVEFDRKVRLWRQHGMTALDAFPEFGFNYRMTDLHAAVGREQLKRLPVMLSRRRDQIQRYKKSLSVISGLQLPAEPSWARSNWQSFCVRLPDTRSPAAVVATLATAGIAARQGIACAHRQPQYSGVKHGPLTESEIAQDHCLILPLYHQLTDDDQDRVIRTMIEACGEK